MLGNNSKPGKSTSVHSTTKKSNRGPLPSIIGILILIVLVILLMAVTDYFTSWLSWPGWSGVQGLTSVLGLLSLVALIYEFITNRHRISKPNIEVWPCTSYSAQKSGTSGSKKTKKSFIKIENTGGTAATIVSLATKCLEFKNTGGFMFKDVLLPGDSFNLEVNQLNKESEIIVVWVSHADYRVTTFQRIPVYGRVQREFRPHLSPYDAACLWIQNEWWFSPGQEKLIYNRLLFVRKDRDNYISNIKLIMEYLVKEGYHIYHSVEN